MSPHRDRSRRIVVALLIGASLAGLALAVSCGRRAGEGVKRLPENLYGFYLGETKEETFARAKGIAHITRAPEPPLGYRGELYNFSASLEPHPEVEYVRCAFFEGRLMEVIVYLRNPSLQNLRWLKLLFEARFNAPAVAEESSKEMAQKTYRIQAGEMSVTIRRITKKERIELYVQFLHEELVRRLREKAEEVESE